MSAYVIGSEQVVAGFVLHAFWQVPLLAGAGWCAVKVGRPHVRVAHAIWLGTLLLCVVLPVCSTVAARRAALQAQRDAATAGISFEPAAYDGTLPALQRESAWKRLLYRHVNGREGLQPFAFSLPLRASRFIACGYLAAVALFSLQLLTAWRRARRLVRRSSCESLPAGLREALQRQCALLHLGPPAMHSSDEIAGPVLAGVLRPTLLLPTRALDAMDHAEIEAVLLHELAHLRRRDPLLHALCSVLLLPVSFHPAAWWASQCIRQTREMACDAEAADRLGSHPAYARSLLQVAERMEVGRRHFSGLGFFGNGLFGAGLELFNRSGAMEERMQMLMKANQPEARSRRIARVAACVSVGAVAVLAAGMLQVRPALAGERVTPQSTSTATTSDAAAQQAAVDAGPRLLGGELAREQLQQARRDLLRAERQATRDDDRRRIAMAREVAAAAESALASADSPRNLNVNVDLSKLDVQLAKLKMPDMAAVQANLEQQKKAFEKMRVEISSPEWRAQIQRQQENAARISREMNSPEWKARMQKQQQALARATEEINSPEFRAKIEAASKVDSAKIAAMVADAQRQQSEHARSGAMQRQIDQAAQIVARNEVPPPPMSAAAPEPIKVPSAVMAGNALTRKMPVYPPEAKEKKMQGEVLLHAIISEEGKVEQLSVISSPDKMFSTSAVDAVREWTYKPYLLNGQPTAVDTTITVHYSLAE